ncbi:unnamed protein product, partial [Symbiodinium sp. KB8]
MQSLAAAEMKACEEAVFKTCMELVLDPKTWTNKHAGIIASAAIGGGWLRKGSRLTMAMCTSPVVALQWPVVKRTVILAETITTLWRSKLPVHSPVYLELDAADEVQRCTFTVGTLDGRCWCEQSSTPTKRDCPYLHSSPTPENSTCIIFKTPFTAEGEIQFRRANGERIRAPSERWMRIEDCLDHIFKFRWHGEQLELLVDNTHIITLPLGESQWVDPWSRTAAMWSDAFENTSGSSRLDDDVYMELLSEVQYFPRFGTRAHYLAFELHDLWQRTWDSQRRSHLTLEACSGLVKPSNPKP